MRRFGTRRNIYNHNNLSKTKSPCVKNRWRGGLGGEKCTIITEGRTLFSRSHLNISFKSIDLLCCDLHGPILCN